MHFRRYTINDLVLSYKIFIKIILRQYLEKFPHFLIFFYIRVLKMSIFSKLPDLYYTELYSESVLQSGMQYINVQLALF